MKIGIITFWWSKDNYGQQLQCFALQKYLQDAGHDAFLIRYDYRNDKNNIKKKKSPFIKAFKIFYPYKLYKYLLYKKIKFVNIRENKKNNARKFEEFREKHLKQSKNIYNNYDELKKNPPDADVYVVGSDQVWNPDYISFIGNRAKVYFLDFGDSSIKRISYAASFGKDKVDNDFIGLITPFLQNFKYISVREKSGLNILKQCGINNAEWVCDPTMLLDAEAYRSLYTNESLKKPDKPYCFFYFLKNECNFSINNFYNWAKNKGLDVIYVSANMKIDKYKKRYLTIPEWIYLLENAEYIVTNSYHCAVFSLIFSKKFGIIPLTNKEIGMNSRMDSLFEQFQIKERYIYSDMSIIATEVDWQSVSNIFIKLRNECKLKKIIKLKK